MPSYTAEAVRQRLVAVAAKDPEHLLFFTRKHTPLTTYNVRRLLRTILAAAGITGVTPHAFRRTVATAVDRAAGTDLAASLLGHSSPEITRRHYIEKNAQVDARTAEILEQFAPADEGGESDGG